MLIDTILQSMVYIPMILGIFLTFKLLKLTDLTADGSFVLGSGIYSRFLLMKYPYFACIILGVLGGFLVGTFLAFIQRNNKIPSLIASILCVFMLYSVNLLVMGRPNISLLEYNTPFNLLLEKNENVANLLIFLVICLIVILFIILIKSKLGLIIRAFGCNYNLTKQENYKPELIRLFGLGLSNSLYAISGILTTHIQCFCDINMGVGIALIGIGSVIIGIQLFSILGIVKSIKFFVVRETFASIVGICFYFLLMNLLLRLNIDPNLLKLVLGLVLTFIFAIKFKSI
ncbi:MAG: ABC transporter permease [Bacteroidetes bacterium]|nr:ABC transporter permease [Bacteroidota bacterium]